MLAAVEAMTKAHPVWAARRHDADVAAQAITRDRAISHLFWARRRGLFLSGNRVLAGVMEIAVSRPERGGLVTCHGSTSATRKRWASATGMPCRPPQRVIRATS
ncbi:hypothetical protein Pstu01_26340 [Stutzerimonas stutzeri]|nr:hypothetical protein Pstu01_26340 [Stutzerimonas stutzeri]